MGPATLAALSIGTSVIGTGVQMIGGYEQSQAQAASANYNAQVARNNQIIAQQNAQIALDQGNVAEQAQRQKTAQLIGADLAQEAASGVNPNSGSALDVRSSDAQIGELNALTTRYNAALKARDYENQASSFGAQAELYSAQAGWDQTAGFLNMGSSLLGGASSVSDKWLKYKQLGIF
jgi:hypothetical protein